MGHRQNLFSIPVCLLYKGGGILARCKNHLADWHSPYSESILWRKKVIGKSMPSWFKIFRMFLHNIVAVMY